MNKLLKKIYTSVEHPASYSSPEKLFQAAKAIDNKVTRKDVQNFLQQENSYTLHRRAVRKFPRLKYKPAGLHTTWQADLAIVDARDMRKANDNMPYFLVCVDLLSRFVYTTFVVSKQVTEILKNYFNIKF